MTATVSTKLAEALHALGPFDPEVCMSCGTCTATCPLRIDVLPRRVLRDAALGLEDHLREEADAIFSCLLCRACESACPAGVHISEDIRLLRRYLLEKEAR